MDKIKKMSTVLKYVFWLLLILIPLTESLGWILFDGFDGWAVPDVLFSLEGENFPLELSMTSRLLGMLATSPCVLLDMFCVWQMMRLFSLYSQGRIFTGENSSCYRRAAWALLGSEILYPLVQAGASLAVSMDNPVGERFVSIGFNDANLGSIVVACVVLAVSWVMDEGRKLQEDAELTI
ncbi:DUF2975 domain-containing protein [Maridesulfovibrio sp. FT414]|uniref:DUF2975 domain-containing protein n=1 Tax=Maridesulfovibrio sp. FT414 TaxID=2979469 RepID=UPI003D803E27